MSVPRSTVSPEDFVYEPSLRVIGAIFWIEYIPHNRYRIYNRLLISYIDDYATLESHYDLYMGEPMGRSVDERVQ